MDIKAVAAQVASGVSAITIPRAKAAPASVSAGWESAMVLRDFLPFGGEVRAMAPTEARLV